MDVEAKRMEKNALIDHPVAAQEIVRDTHADGILLGLISQAISLDDWPYYDANALSEDIRDAFLKREKCLLHMAIMRAQERVLLTSANKRPLELPRESCGQTPAPEDEND